LNLSSKQRRYLRSLAHHLDPVVQIGDRGLTEEVMSKVDMELEVHELIKVKIASKDRAERDAMGERIERKTGSGIVQRIGKVVILYRPRSKKPTLKLPGPVTP
jgi:RNA-binding protein